MKRKFFFFAVILLTVVSTSAEAHDFSTSYSRIEAEGPIVNVTLTMGATDFHRGPDIDQDGNGRVVEEELDAGIELLFRAVAENFYLQTDTGSAASVLEGYSLTAENVLNLELRFQFEEDVRDVTVVSTLDRITQDDHRHLLQVGDGDDTRTGVLDQANPSIDVNYLTGIPFWVTTFDFVRLGVEHIFTGYDHLAFLLALLLATTTLLSLAKIVTCFTIGHSVTLVLATLGVVILPSRLIESLIALSIAYVAVENFVGRTLVHRWMVTLLFGFVHGFGFSNVLREMGLGRSRLAISLFSFNFGVELGQLAFVALLFPVLLYVGRSRWKDHVMSAASVAIMCLGFYWFVLRAFFI